MEALQIDTYNEDDVSVLDDLFEEDTDQYIRGRFFRRIAGLVFIAYAIMAFVLEMKMGHYAIKIAILVSTALLLFSRPSYPYLLGLLIPVYYFLKTRPDVTVEANYVAHYTPVMIILMAVSCWAGKIFGNLRRNPYQHFDLGSLCLLGIIGLAILGYGRIENRFLYFNRMVYLVGFACAFYLGRSCINIPQSLKLLLIGLALGILAFEIPFSVGFILRRGVSIAGRLDWFRSEIGAGTGIGSESGTVLVPFALAYSLSSSAISLKTRRIALWLVAVPAAVVIMIFLSKGAVLLLPVIVFLNLIFSAQRKSAMLAALIAAILGVLAFVLFPGLFISFIERMADLPRVAATRSVIRTEAIGFGLSHPLLGIGAGQYALLGEVSTAHNEELNILAEHGIIGFLLYILFCIYLVYMALKLRASKYFSMRSLAGVFLVLVLVHFAYIQIQPMYFNRGGLLFNFLVGMLATLYYRSQSEQEVTEEGL